MTGALRKHRAEAEGIVAELASGETALGHHAPRSTLHKIRPPFIAVFMDSGAYGDLDAFRITIERERDGWHIDYELKDPNLDGGGPHYVIDPGDGTIVSKRYEQ